MAAQVVQIVCGEGWGTGTAVAPGFVLTAKHVVEGCEEAGFDLQVIWTHSERDVAVIGWATNGPLVDPPMRAPILGENITCIGYPARPGDNRTTLTVTTGVVASIEGTKMRVTCPIYYGNSGGPVYGDDGYQIGVVVSMLAFLGLPYDGWYYAESWPYGLYESTPAVTESHSQE